MIAVTGYNTTIVQSLIALCGVTQVKRIDSDLSLPDCTFKIPTGADKFVLAAGVLCGKRLMELTPDDVQRMLSVNLVNTMRLCETILESKPRARICVIGSESGFKGSYDTLYAVSKAGLHKYVETRKVGPKQQLVAIAPHIILDSGMTRARADYNDLLFQKAHGRKFTTAIEVAGMARFLLTERYTFNNHVFRITPC